MLKVMIEREGMNSYEKGNTIHANFVTRHLLSKGKETHTIEDHCDYRPCSCNFCDGSLESKTYLDVPKKGHDSSKSRKVELEVRDVILVNFVQNF